MAIPLKRVRDIRTHMGRSPGNRAPYELFMQVSALEMERARRGKERAAAMLRVASIEARFKEIDAEKTRLLAAASLALSGGELGPADRQAAEKARREAVLGVSQPRAGGFRIKY